MENPMVLLLKRGKASGRRGDVARELTLQARALLSADDDTVVSVSEHDCGDPDCGEGRTVVLVLRPDRPTAAVKINKPIERVTGGDLSAALAPLADQVTTATADDSARAPTRFDW
jgi:hypothetical protein